MLETKFVRQSSLGGKEHFCLQEQKKMWC